MEHFDVFVAGFEVAEERATRGLMQAFGLSESAARIFVRSTPRMAKRRQPRDAAERYARTLQAVGGIVECRPSEPTLPPPTAADLEAAGQRAPGITSLPVPGSFRPSLLSASRSSLSSRAAGGGTSRMPDIPRAPRVPSELQPRVPNELHASQPPEWFEHDPTYDNRMLSRSAPTSSLPGIGARTEEQLDHSRSGPTPELFSPSEGLSPSSHAPARASGSHPHTFESLPPGVPQRFSVITLPKARWYKEPSSFYPLLLMLAALGYFGVRHHWFETEHGRREARWRAAGIEFGRYEDARRFIEAPEDRFEGLSNQRLEDLIDALSRAGVAHVWVIDIVRSAGHATAGSLLIELPRDPGQRDTVFWQDLKDVTRTPLTDTGQAFLRLDLAASR